MTSSYEKEVAIIGAGPCGLFAIFECGMMGLHCKVFDTLETMGGQCSALYPQKPIYDIPAHPKITGQELIEQLRLQAERFAPTFYLGHRVLRIEKKGNLFCITTDKTREYVGAVIIAAGAGLFAHKRPPLEHIETYEGHAVFYAVQDPMQFQGKRVVIAGGGDSAIDWALILSDICEQVYMIHRRTSFRAHPLSVQQIHKCIEEKKINLIAPYQLDALIGNGTKLEAVIVKNDNDILRLDADYLLAFFGMSMDIGPLKEFGLEMHKNQIIINQATSKTSSDGIYAIGDVAYYPFKQKLILCGFAEAAQAAKSIWEYLFPGESKHFSYSTSQFNES